MTGVTPSLVSSLLAILVANGATAAPAEAQLPTESVKLRPSNLPGFAIAAVKCAICHSADYIAYQPPQMNQSQWTAEVSKMHGTYGAPVDANDIRLVGLYLTATYGDAKSISAADMTQVAGNAPTGAVSSPASAAQRMDVQALLNGNACLGCHGLKQKIVGPAYADVAARYRSDPQALSKVMSNIRQGGVGRWGQVPMPAFAGLDDNQLKALAAFVLAQ